MAEIHYSVHILLGILVTTASWLNKSMRFFIIFGIIFIILGLIKLFKQKSQRKSAEVKKTDSKEGQVLKFNPDHYKKCPNCGAILPKIHRFCPYCGYGV